VEAIFPKSPLKIMLFFQKVNRKSFGFYKKSFKKVETLNKKSLEKM